MTSTPLIKWRDSGVLIKGNTEILGDTTIVNGSSLTVSGDLRASDIKAGNKILLDATDGSAQINGPVTLGGATTLNPDGSASISGKVSANELDIAGGKVRINSDGEAVFGTATFNGPTTIYDDVMIGEEQITLNTDGTATFKAINIGDGPDIQLNQNGSAAFKGPVDIGGSITLNSDGSGVFNSSGVFREKVIARELDVADGSVTISSSGDLLIGSSNLSANNTAYFGGEVAINGKVTAHELDIGPGNVTINPSGEVTIGNTTLNTSGATIGGSTIINGPAIINGQVSVNNEFEVGGRKAIIDSSGNATFPSLTASDRLTLHGTALTNVITSTTVPADTTSDTSIPTIGYVTKAIEGISKSVSEPIQITSTIGEEQPKPTYSFQIVMWIKNAENPSNSKYFGKQYIYKYDNSKSDYVFSEKFSSIGSGKYPWAN